MTSMPPYATLLNKLAFPPLAVVSSATLNSE